ncbi:MAG: NAD+ synthase [Acidiferrobacterales bacterium]
MPDTVNNTIKIILAQQNFMVGDFKQNLIKLRAAIDKSRDELSADLIVFPELALCGYPPEDLLLRKGFLDQNQRALAELALAAKGITVIIGHPLIQPPIHSPIKTSADQANKSMLFNGASLLRNGQVVATYSKQNLPNYGVFDEKRYFTAGRDPCVFELCNIKLGITICEDIWVPDVARQAKEAGADVIVNLNASPFHINKQSEREAEVKKRARETGLPVLYVNLVGGQDELVFDGGSFAVDQSGKVCARAVFYDEQLLPVTLANNKKITMTSSQLSSVPDLENSIYEALVLGVREYVEKNGFPGVVIGLSGGIDSALTMVIAVDALGSDKVEAVIMPSRYTANMSIEDARSQAGTLNVKLREIPIEPMVKSFSSSLKEEFSGTNPDSTEENIQARIRGVLLMAISNKFGKMVLTTGNKSEMAVGYATLYGDMAGGYAAIKDVPKTMVYRLAKMRNQRSAVIPERVLARPPSAELAPDQKDSDSLPEYEVLDQILESYIELDQCAHDIIDQGFDAGIVSKVIKLVDRNEYKRRQAAPGVRITQRAFGRDRRYPVTSGYGKG